MFKQQFQRRYRWPLAVILCLGGAAAIAADPPPPAPAAELRPSAAAFDTLFRRLDIGELIVVGNQRQKGYVAELQRLVPPGDAHRQRLLDAAHCSFDFVDAIAQGAAFAEEKLAGALASGDSEAIARLYYCRGGYKESLATPLDAIADYDKGIELARKIENAPLAAQGLAYRGSVNSVLGFHGKALADLLSAQRAFVLNEAPEAAHQTFQSIGTAYRRLGYLDKAREYLSQSIDYEQTVGDRETLFSSTLQLGFTEEESGNYAKALQFDERAIEIGQASHTRGIEAPAQIAAASTLIELRRFDEALEFVDRAEAAMATIGDSSARGMIAFERGRARAGLGQHVQAIDAFARAETASDFKDNRRYLELLFAARAASFEALGRVPAALQDMKRYIAVHDEVMRQRADQQAQMLREQFDADRSNLENARLKAEQALTDRQVEALQRERGWQKLALGLLAVLIGLLSLLTLRQLARLRIWKRMASMDALTGVGNRRAIDLFGKRAFERCRTQREALSILVIDIDLFKRINDRHGHPVGDRALMQIAQAVQDMLRAGDLLGRVGGEEFVAVLPGTSHARAIEIAERLRAGIEHLRFSDLPEGLHATISIGVADLRAQDDSIADVEKRADDALYRAKTEGRNRVFAAEPEQIAAATDRRVNVGIAASR
ncbi:MAG: GGDEF domain-containing protein [Rudaea sp.]